MLFTAVRAGDVVNVCVRSAPVTVAMSVDDRC